MTRNKGGARRGRRGTLQRASNPSDGTSLGRCSCLAQKARLNLDASKEASAGFTVLGAAPG